MQQVNKSYALQSLNTFGISCEAAFFTEVNTVDALREVLLNKEFDTLPKMILGGGSNILFTKPYSGLIIKNAIGGIEIVEEDDTQVILKAGAGVNWHSLVMYAVERGYGGIENLSLIPGTVGAAPMQNIGAYGVEIKDVFVQLEAVERATGKLRVFTSEQCAFGYRQSVFKQHLKDQYVIVSMSVRLSKQPDVNTSYGAIEDTLAAMGITQPGIKDVSDAVISIRQSKLPDPKEIGNAGSFFKNPVIDAVDFEGLKAEFESIPGYDQPGQKVKVPAGWLIEQCGWKGRRLGDVGVHKNQALVLVNYGGGSGADVFALAKDIQASVADKFGIELEMEVNVV